MTSASPLRRALRVEMHPFEGTKRTPRWVRFRPRSPNHGSAPDLGDHERPIVTATVSREQDRPRVDQQRVDGAVVVQPIGRLDADLVGDVRQVALEAHAPVIVDLTGSVLIDPIAVQRIAHDWELYRPRMCIVCPRPTGRELLVRAGLHEHLAIFDDAEVALDALRSSTDAADGWSPSTAAR